MPSCTGLPRTRRLFNYIEAATLLDQYSPRLAALPNYATQGSLAGVPISAIFT
ncbi:hypothetical protein [Rhodoferax sp. PAMC 29310]|uniref:hypothetical protein n=1 Tax=Rhodoferax sp. PAMC 29310 TaxID=2822760 RepID=UPI001B343E43|nr:hypothetical protein [Rhodoferax sp. PAMC 29310]